MRLTAMVRIVEQAREQARIDEPFHCTSAVSDGETTWAIRYSSRGEPRSLYYSDHADALCDFESCSVQLPGGGVIVASEPLGSVGKAWREVPPDTILTIDGDGISQARISL